MGGGECSPRTGGVRSGRPCLSWLSQPREGGRKEEEEPGKGARWPTEVRLGHWVVEGFPFLSLSRPLERKGRKAGMAEDSRSEIKHYHLDHYRLIAQHYG